MIYGDNPQTVNQRQDALGLTSYTHVPQITAIMQSGNLYVYGVNNPVLYRDPSGQVMVVTILGIEITLEALFYATGLTILSGVVLFSDIRKDLVKSIQYSFELAKSAADEAMATRSNAVTAPAVPDPDDDENGSEYKAPKGGGGVSDSIKVGNRQIDFGHGGRHLKNTGLSLKKVQRAIANDVIKQKLGVNTFRKLIVNIDGVKVQYSAYLLQSGNINIGTFFVVP